MPKPPRRPLRWKKLFFRLLMTIAVLLAVELALRLAGVQPITEMRDPFVGFSEQVPLMETVRDEAGTEYLRTARSKLVWFNDQAFAKKRQVVYGVCFAWAVQQLMVIRTMTRLISARRSSSIRTCRCHRTSHESH